MQAAAELSEILGGAKRLGRRASSLTDFDDMVRKGLPWAAAAHAKEIMALSDRAFASILDISPRTLARLKKSRQRLNLTASDRLYRLARLVSLASKVLEGKSHALVWLNRPQVGLGGRVPLDLLRTGAGAREVEDLLGRLEFGVVS